MVIKHHDNLEKVPQMGRQNNRIKIGELKDQIHNSEFNKQATNPINVLNQFDLKDPIKHVQHHNNLDNNNKCKLNKDNKFNCNKCNHNKVNQQVNKQHQNHQEQITQVQYQQQ